MLIITEKIPPDFARPGRKVFVDDQGELAFLGVSVLSVGQFEFGSLVAVIGGGTAARGRRDGGTGAVWRW